MAGFEVLILYLQVPLVGAVGQEYVHNVLSNLRPDIGLREIQRRGAFQDKRYDPLLKLLDHLGLKRYALPFAASSLS